MNEDDLRTLASLSAQLLDIKKQKEDAEKAYQEVRKSVFAISDRIGGEESKVAVEVLATGRRIGRSMVYGSPHCDLDILLDVVGKEVFDRVTTTTVTRIVDFEALAKALKDEVVTESMLRKALVAGKVQQRLLHSKIGSAEDKRQQEGAVTKSLLEGLVEF